MNKMYYQMTQSGRTANINIYGDITSFPWSEGDTSAHNLSKKLAELGDVDEINVYINSYGGECAEGLAIYTALKRHKAKIRTFCDGFACSIASVIFMAGDERIMSEASLLMIHNAWTWCDGNADQLRKQADDLDKITQASINAYKANSNLSEEEIKAMLDAETWLLPEEAMEHGFATAIEKAEHAHASQNAKKQMLDIIKKFRSAADDDSTTDDVDDIDDDPVDDPVDNPDDNIDNENPSDDPDSDEDPDDDDADDVPSEEMAAQRWSGFFNALLKNN